MKNKLPLSIVILTNRNDKRFKECLKSAQFAQEVIVEKHKDIVDFSKARNKVLKKAKQPWVFFLDSDEVITSESIQAIEKVIIKNKLDGVFVKRKDIFFGKTLGWGEVGNVWLLRMFKKDNVKFTRPVHERALVKGVVKRSRITLNHNAHSSFTEFIRDITKYSELEAKFRLKKTNYKKNKILFEMLVFPSAKFMVNFFLKLGFLDGWRGFSYAIIMSMHSLIIRVFLYEFSKTNHS